MKKSRITAIIICIFLLSFAFGACAGNKEEKREYLINGFKRSNGHNKSKLQSKQPIQCKTDKYSSNKQ